MRNVLVRNLMSKKVYALHKAQSLRMASELMRIAQIRHVPVIDDARHVIGIVSDRDLAAAKIPPITGLTAEQRAEIQFAVPISRVMKTDVWTVGPHTTAVDAARIMLEQHFSCLPVVRGSRLIGIITDADLLTHLVVVLESKEVPNPGSRPTRPVEAQLPGSRKRARARHEPGPCRLATEIPIMGEPSPLVPKAEKTQPGYRDA